YLIDAGRKVKKINKRTNMMYVTAVVLVMIRFYDYIYGVFDLAHGYEKHICDGKKLPIELNYTNTGTKKKKFTKVNQVHKELVKKYLYTRIVELKNIRFSIGIRYVVYGKIIM